MPSSIDQKNSASKIEVESIDDKTHNEILDDEEIIFKSQLASTDAHNMTTLEAFKRYKYALFWALFIHISVIMAGFDPSIIGNVVGVDSFRRDFGYLYEGKYVVKAAWLSAFNYAPSIGKVCGSLIGGKVIDKYGCKITLLIACSGITGTIFIQFFAASPPVLFVGELLTGLCLGCFPVVTNCYATEVAPLPLRGMFAAFVNLGFVIGQFFASGVLKGTQDRDDHWAYKIPFACQWIWPVVILSGLYFAPESPWWLVRKGKLEKAKKSLLQLTPDLQEDKLDNEISIMQQTIEIELQKSKSESYVECFRGTNFRRTVIACMVYCIQPLSGQVLVISYCVYFFESAGLSDSDAFSLGLGLTAIGFVGTVLSWPLMQYVGRRTLFNYPMFILALMQFIIAFIDLPSNYGSAHGWAQSILMILWAFIYDLSIGPVAFVYMSEVASTKIRSKTISLATASVLSTNVVFSVVVPYMINSDEGNLRGKCAFVFGGLCLLCAIWSYFELPETANRTFEEIDVMFDRKVPARKFKTYNAEKHLPGYSGPEDENELA